jgi:hypothetical protein
MTASNEWPADIVFWFKDGMCCSYRARAAAGVEISIGLADSMRGLGFIVSRGDTSIDFVLDRDQVTELAAYLQGIAHPRMLTPRGRKRNKISIAAMVSIPKKRRRR